MTLIIARLFKGEVQIDSDTITLNPLEITNVTPTQSPTLKTIVLDRNISVSFAGDVDKAKIAVRQIFELNDFKLDTVKSILLRANINSDNHVEFIIAFSSDIIKLFKVSDKQIYEGDEFYWIGDFDAFYQFRKYVIETEEEMENHYSQIYSQGEKFKDHEEFFQLIKSPHSIQEKAFEKVVNDEKIINVGGFHISLKSQNKRQNYPSMVRLVSGRAIQLLPTTEPQPIFRDSSAETGSYSVTYLNSEEPFHPLFGIYFSFGSFGILFYPRLFDDYQVYTKITFNTFRQKIREEFKIETSSLSLS